MSKMSTETAYGSQDNELNLAELFHELLGHKWLLLLTTVLGLTFGIFYALKQPAQYQSNVLLQVDGGKNGGAHGGGLANQLLGGAGEDSAATQVALIQSRFILEPVVEALGLNFRTVQQPTSILGRLFPWAYKQEAQVIKFEVPEDQIKKSFQLVSEKPDEITLYTADKQKILSGPLGKELTNDAHTVQLQVEAEGIPVGTKFKIIKRSNVAVAKSLAGSLKVEEIGGKTRTGIGTGVLELSLKGPKKEEVPRVLDAIAETARLKDTQKKAEEAHQTLNFLEHQLPITKQLLESSEQALNTYRAKSGKIDIKIQTQFLLQQLADLDGKLSALQIKEIEMRQQYKKTHPARIALDAQVQALKVQRTALEKHLKKLPASDQIAVNLMRDVEVKQTLYMLLLNKIQELEVVKAGTVSGVRILSYATLPEFPIPSKSRLLALGSAMLGLMLGILFIFARKLVSPRVDDPHWSERYLNLPNVATIPFCLRQTESTLLPLKGSLLLLANTHPKDLAVEALRSLRTSLQVTLACAENNVIGILGVSPSVGKSFVSANLAYLLAAAGKRVLLIDSDLRKGTQHRYFSLKAAPGFSELLSENASIEEVLKPSSHSNLTLLPRGAYPQDPAELLSSERFKALIKNFSQQYDIVLFDTAPILLVTDAVLVGSVASTNFLVVGAGVHQPSDIEVVIKRLRHADVHVNGSIFNFHNAKTSSYGYGKYYNYSYAYYHDETEKN